MTRLGWEILQLRLATAEATLKLMLTNFIPGLDDQLLIENEIELEEIRHLMLEHHEGEKKLSTFFVDKNGNFNSK